jgi:hypothetical protein
MRCKECYSAYSRMTPLFQAEECLQHHMQYICSTCGRVICVDKGESEKARCFRLFKSLEIAMLYVRAAEVLTNDVRGIYEIKSIPSGKLSYKIFSHQEDMVTYFQRNKDRRCSSEIPLFISKEFVPVKAGQIRLLSPTNDKDKELELSERSHLNRPCHTFFTVLRSVRKVSIRIKSRAIPTKY